MKLANIDAVREYKVNGPNRVELGRGRHFDQKSELPKALFDLGDILERHIRREERELFPLFEHYVPPAEAEQAKGEIERILYLRKHSL